MEIGTPVALELVVEISSSGKEDETSVTKVKNSDKERKRLLHVKSWMGENKTGVDSLISTCSACNLM